MIKLYIIEGPDCLNKADISKLLGTKVWHKVTTISDIDAIMEVPVVTRNSSLLHKLSMCADTVVFIHDGEDSYQVELQVETIKRYYTVRIFKRHWLLNPVQYYLLSLVTTIFALFCITLFIIHVI